MRKLFAFDIDGTLVDHTDHKIPQSTLDSLKELKEQGHIVGIATGRNRFQLQKVVDENDFDFIILCNGAYAEIDQKIVHNHPFDKHDVEKIFEIARKHDYEFMITDENHLFAHNPYTDKLTRVVNHFDLITPDIGKNLNEKNIYQIIICEPIEVIRSFNEMAGSYLFHTFGQFGFDIDQKTQTKGDALVHICEHFNVDLKDAIAFGDADNDIKFIKNAGTGVAMGNAVPEVKEVADYITTNVSNHGIKNALQHLGFIRR